MTDLHLKNLQEFIMKQILSINPTKKSKTKYYILQELFL